MNEEDEPIKEMDVKEEEWSELEEGSLLIEDDVDSVIEKAEE